MDANKSCISCGMPLRTAQDHALGDVSKTYCQHCAADDGSLKSYDQVLTGLTEFLKRTQGVDGAVAREVAAGMLAKNPAWTERR